MYEYQQKHFTFKCMNASISYIKHICLQEYVLSEIAASSVWILDHQTLQKLLYRSDQSHYPVLVGHLEQCFPNFFSGGHIFFKLQTIATQFKIVQYYQKHSSCLKFFLNANAELVGLCLRAAIVIKQSINHFEQSTLIN